MPRLRYKGGNPIRVGDALVKPGDVVDYPGELPFGGGEIWETLGESDPKKEDLPADPDEPENDPEDLNGSDPDAELVEFEPDAEEGEEG